MTPQYYMNQITSIAVKLYNETNNPFLNKSIEFKKNINSNLNNWSFCICAYPARQSVLLTSAQNICWMGIYNICRDVNEVPVPEYHQAAESGICIRVKGRKNWAWHQHL